MKRVYRSVKCPNQFCQEVNLIKKVIFKITRASAHAWSKKLLPFTVVVVQASWKRQQKIGEIFFKVLIYPQLNELLIHSPHLAGNQNYESPSCMPKIVVDLSVHQIEIQKNTLICFEYATQLNAVQRLSYVLQMKRKY